MTAACSICHALISGDVPKAITEDREAREFSALGLQHYVHLVQASQGKPDLLGQQQAHHEALQRITGAMSELGAFLATFMLTGADRVEAAREVARAALVEAITNAGKQPMKVPAFANAGVSQP